MEGHGDGPLARLPPAALGELGSARVAHLATADAAGKPHVIPVCFALDGDRIVSVIDRKPKVGEPARLRRLRNIAANPRVALVVDRYSEEWEQLGYVLVDGVASVAEDGEPHARALEVLRAKYPQYRAMDLAGRPVISIRIERARAWGVFDEPANRGDSAERV